MAVFIIVFAIAGALFFGLRFWGKRMQARAALLPAPEDGETLGDRIGANVDNLEFAADLALRAARRAKVEDGAADGAGDGGGGDGG